MCVAGPVTRPLAVGLVHGLTGSAEIALLAATTIGSRPLAVAYLGLVALGTVIRMVSLTIVMSRPIGPTMCRPCRMKQAVTILAAAMSLGLSMVVFVRALLGDAAH